MRNKIQSNKKQVSVLFCDQGQRFENTFIPMLQSIIDEHYGKEKVVLSREIYDDSSSKRKEADILISCVYKEEMRHCKAKVKILVLTEPNDTRCNRTDKERLADLVLDTNLEHVKSINRPGVHMPFIVHSFKALTPYSLDCLKKTPEKVREWMQNKTKFCAYMYSYDVPLRCRMFDLLNAKKSVDGLGVSRHNCDISEDRYQINWANSAMQRYVPYKFVISFEHGSYPGDITEKLLYPMIIGAIPIYWGPADFLQHIPLNPKAYINVRSFPNFEKCVEEIIRIDHDHERYAAMLSEPWFVDSRIPSILEGKEIHLKLKELLEEHIFKSL